MCYTTSYAVLELVCFFCCRLCCTGDAFDDGTVDADSYASEGMFDSFAIELSCDCGLRSFKYCLH